MYAVFLRYDQDSPKGKSSVSFGVKHAPSRQSAVDSAKELRLQV